jgi:para-aminobenzoate synthetase component I
VLCNTIIFGIDASAKNMAGQARPTKTFMAGQARPTKTFMAGQAHPTKTFMAGLAPPKKSFYSEPLMPHAIIQQEELPYKDGSQYLAKLRDLPWPILLDSGQPDSSQGRYDIVSAAPHTTLTTLGDTTVILRGGERLESADCPFHLIQERLPARDDTSDLPFSTGAMGYFGYDLGRRLETLPSTATRDIDFPDMAIGIYGWSLLIDHQLETAHLIFDPDYCCAEFQDEIRQRLSAAPPPMEHSFALTTPWQHNMTREQYAQTFKNIIDYIVAGDIYEVNLTQRFSAGYSGDCWQAYQQLRQVNPVPFGGYFEIDAGTILSFSPERFLQVRDGRVETKPIKGTRPRGKTPAEDDALAAELQSSEKDKAENVMIVDLMRNDLSKTCRYGSVDVPQLFALESFPSVHHLVSTVVGELKPNCTSLDCLRASFPGGSITGAPKIRAMEIIEACEPTRRSVYCGSLGYINGNGDMDTNIAIRTLIAADDIIHCAAGGAIVADSDVDAEYQECLDKVALIRETLETRTHLK